MNPFFKLFKIEDPFLEFDRNVEKYGFSHGCTTLVHGLGLNIKADLKKFPQQGAVLVYSNHPTGLDPFILGSVLGRDDYIFLGDEYQAKKGKNIAKHIASTVSTSFWKDFFRRRPTNWPGYLNMRKTVPVVDKIKAKEINNLAITSLTKNLKDGHLSVVFPSGGEYEFLPWKLGLAKIISEARKENIKYVLYRIHFKRFSELKLIGHFLSGRKFYSNLEIVGYSVNLPKFFYETDSKTQMHILKSL